MDALASLRLYAKSIRQGEDDMAYRFVGFGAAIAMFSAVPAQATVLVSGSGWQTDEIVTLAQPSKNSNWTFTVVVASTLSLTDAFIPGDIYTLTGGVTGVSTFYAGSVSDAQSTGSYGGYWSDISYSKLAVLLAPGTYSFGITGNGASGAPAGFGVRLDASAVPEPATWVLMTSAFGVMGAMLRRRRRGSLGVC